MKYQKLKITLLIPAVVLLVFFVIALFSPQIAPPNSTTPTNSALSPPSSDHWLGTDDLGVDIFSIMCQGARNSIIVGVLTAILSGLGGAFLGTLSAYCGGRVDKLIMRICDMVMTLPRLPTLIVCASFFSPSTINIILVLLIFSWVHPARILRSRMLAIKHEPYILMAKSYGANFFYLIKRHFFPLLYPLCIVSITSQLSRAITAEASLSLLGLGDPSSSSWGTLVNSAMAFDGLIFTPYWRWWVLPPLVAIALLVAASSLLSRELETWINPKTQNYR